MFVVDRTCTPAPNVLKEEPHTKSVALL